MLLRTTPQKNSENMGAWTLTFNPKTEKNTKESFMLLKKCYERTQESHVINRRTMLGTIRYSEAAHHTE
jgi:hypothetical protein